MIKSPPFIVICESWRQLARQWKTAMVKTTQTQWPVDNAGPVFLYKLRYIVSLIRSGRDDHLDHSIYRTLYENTDPRENRWESTTDTIPMWLVSYDIPWTPWHNYNTMIRIKWHSITAVWDGCERMAIYLHNDGNGGGGGATLPWCGCVLAFLTYT